MKILFLISIALLLGTWVIYPLIMIALHQVYIESWRKKDGKRGGIKELAITIVLPIRNGEKEIERKLCELLSMTSFDKEIIVVSDGSTDRTVAIANEFAKKYSDISVFSTDKSGGKSAAQNLALAKSKKPLVLFTDVGASLDEAAVRLMADEFKDELVGCVGANVKFRWTESSEHKSPGIYWSIEQRVRRAESMFGCLLSLVGSAFMLRREIFTALDEDTGDDLVLPIESALRGYKSVFVEDAIVFDTWPAKSIMNEFHVRRRITLRNALALYRRRKILNPFLYPKYSITLFMHKVLRWTSPLLLISIFAASLYLAAKGDFYIWVVVIEVCVLLVAMLGVTFGTGKSRFVSLCTSFLVANAGMAAGLYSLAIGDRITRYRRTN